MFAWTNNEWMFVVVPQKTNNIFVSTYITNWLLTAYTLALLSGSPTVSGHAPFMSMGSPHMAHAFILPDLSTIT